jgi:hypothetical protein
MSSSVSAVGAADAWVVSLTTALAASARGFWLAVCVSCGEDPVAASGNDRSGLFAVGCDNKWNKDWFMRGLRRLETPIARQSPISSADNFGENGRLG